MKDASQQGIAVGIQYTHGKVIKPTFKLMMDYVMKDPHVGAGIDDIAQSSVGLGFTFSGSDAPHTQDGIDKLEDFCEENNMDGLNLGIAQDLWATGNAIMEQLEPRQLEFIKRLPIDSAQRIMTDEQGNIIALKQYIDGKQKWWRLNPHRREIDIKKLYHMAWNTVDARPIGRGLLHKLVSSGVGYTWTDKNKAIHTEYRPSFMEIKEENDDVMRKIVHRHVSRHVYDFQGSTDEQASQRAQEIDDLRPEDDLVVSSPKIDQQKLVITKVQADTRSRLDAFVQYYWDALLMGLETPTPKLFLEAGFTEASAREATKEKTRRILAFQRFLKREEERYIFRPALMAATTTEFGLGWSYKQWRDAKIRIRWEQDLDVEEIREAFRLGGITRETYQAALVKKYGIKMLEGTYIVPAGREEVFQAKGVKP